MKFFRFNHREKIQPDQNKKNQPGMYNLIILDESGSMHCVLKKTISGCNKTLKCIRNDARKHPETPQFISIYCFNSERPRYVIKNTRAEQVSDLNKNDYDPDGCTPLYDAIGKTTTELKEIVAKTESAVSVTIITDGKENSSKIWTQQKIVSLIDSLKKEGWNFAFIGANIDVTKTAGELNIDNFMEWEQTDAGTSEMFEREQESRSAYNERLRYMRECEFYEEADEKERQELMRTQSRNYFSERGEHITPELVRYLNENEIFVFGSNVKGWHNGGASLYAKNNFGACEGQAEGIQGRSYAIPTVGNTYRDVVAAVRRFTEFAVRHPEMKFLVTRIGCGHGIYTDADIAPLFKTAYSFGNVYIPASFLSIIGK